MVAARPQLRQLLSALAQKLPRDTAEQSAWEPAWTAEVVAALRDLRLTGADPQLCTRLGHTIVQAAPGLQLDALLHAVCDLCGVAAGGAALDGAAGSLDSPRAPDDYALWVLGSRLERLCGSHAPGELPTRQLVHLLHLFAHPAVMWRAPARTSEVVLRHVRHGLPDCGVGELANLLQAYGDSPAVAAEVLAEVGRGAAERLKGAGMAELTAVASALPGQAEVPAGLTAAVLTRLASVVAEGPAASLDLAIAALSGAAEAPVHADAEAAAVARAALRRALSTVGARATAAGGGELDAWAPAAAQSLVPRMEELSTLSLVQLAASLAAVGGDASAAPRFGDAGPALFEAIQTVAISRAPALAVQDLAAVASALAAAGVLDRGLLEAFDVEAALARPLEPATAAELAWAMAVAKLESPTAWALAALQLEGPGWLEAGAGSKSRFYEAIRSCQVVRGAQWRPGSAAAEALEASSWRECWAAQRSSGWAPSALDGTVSSLLEALGEDFQPAAEGSDGLYVMPFFSERKSVVIDHLSVPARHAVSQEARGDLSLRHQVWSATGHSVLGIPDTTWAQLAARVPEPEPAAEGQSSAEAAAEREAAVRAVQAEWLRGRLEGLRRKDLLMEADLQDDVLDLVRDLPVGDGGLNVDALRALADRPGEVRKRAVRVFQKTFEEDRVKSPSGWMIGIIKREAAAYAEEQKKAEERKEASAGTRPDQGWSRPTGKPLEEVKLGERLRGVVTNELLGRVWVNAGHTHDVTFRTKADRFKVDYRLTNLKVVSIDLSRKRIEVEETRQTKAIPPGTAKKSKASDRLLEPGHLDARPPGGARTSNRQGPAAAGGAAKTSRQGPAAAGADAPAWREAAAPRPAAGWQRRGRPLAELVVGEAAAGRVTNVLHNPDGQQRQPRCPMMADLESSSLHPPHTPDQITDDIIFPVPAILLDSGLWGPVSGPGTMRNASGTKSDLRRKGGNASGSALKQYRLMLGKARERLQCYTKQCFHKR
ncbi:unnamed protein product [Prorocentrum cordatum]|uniref:Uncharacterized protein n=1 Tax=Prorocentrum cordatum TaxID=2364126 RepID=A0ABN9XNC4_9DINO|nr:unnamed protein product [Polarella glacialis]